MAVPHVSGTIALMLGAGVLGAEPVARGDRAAARVDGARPRPARLRHHVRLGPAGRRRGDDAAPATGAADSAES